MNYFELFDIPLNFQPDLGVVKKKFYALSRQYHPDLYSGSDETVKAAALDLSAKVNKAYQVFQRQDELIKYILQLKGLLEEEEKYSLPPHFLMEVMELNEQVMEKTQLDSVAMKVVLDNLNKLENSIYEPIKMALTQVELAPISEKNLLAVKAYYFKKKYLDRIRKELDQGI